MVSMTVSALLLCASTVALLHLEAQPLEESHQENAFDKIVKADSPYTDLKDSRHEVDMVLPKLKTSRDRRSLDLHSDFPPPVRETVKLWPNGIVPYTVAYTLNITKHSIAEQNSVYKLIEEAIKEYEKKTCLKFVEREKQANYIEFYSGPGCQSDVGYKGSGNQQLSLGSGCESLDIVLHEIGHAIGFFHEQNRPDRNTYIKVLWNNIISFNRNAYKIQSGWHPDSIRTPYDYYSIMHYGNKDFRINDNVVTMIAKKPGITSFGSNRLSGLDAQRVRRMYKCPEFPNFPRDFIWSHNGRGRTGKTCIKINEPHDIKTWSNNYLCYRSQGKKPLNIRWSNNGPINGMACAKINDPRKPSSTSWNNNYLCVPVNAPYKFKWLLSRPSPQERRNCKRINEPRDGLWNRAYHYLCATDRETDKRDGQWSAWGPWGTCSLDCGTGQHARVRECSNPYPANGGKSCEGKDFERGKCNTQPCVGLPIFPEDFSYFESNGMAPRGHCLRIYTFPNYFEWFRYLFCTSPSKTAPGIVWSFSGPRHGMRCTKIYNPAETRLKRGSWTNNYLCVPIDSPYHFEWSIKGPIQGLRCLRWYAKEGQRGWDKTYLCNKRQTKSIFAYRQK